MIATGGLSIPTMGASPFGYKIAKQFAINIWPTSPALVPFTLNKNLLTHTASLAGISLPCEVSCKGHFFKEGMLFTHRGLSGPAILQISSYWQPQDRLTINFLPHKDLVQIVKELQKVQPSLLLKTVLNRYLPKRMITTWLVNLIGLQTLGQCTDKRLVAIADLLQNWHIVPSGTEGYQTAEVTRGGVDCDALSSKTFQVKQVKGLFFIGEVLDVTGWLGGYNFQWAWASGFAAGSVV